MEERRLAFLASIDGLCDSRADATSVGHPLSRRSNPQSKQDAKIARQLAEMPAIVDGVAAGLPLPNRPRHGYRRATPKELLALAADLRPTSSQKKRENGSTLENLATGSRIVTIRSAMRRLLRRCVNSLTRSAPTTLGPTASKPTTHGNGPKSGQPTPRTHPSA